MSAISKSERLYEAITNLPDETVERAQSVPLGKARWGRWTALAACLCLVIGGAWAFVHFQTGGSSGDTSGPSAPAAGGPGMDGHGEGSTFMSYAGPVFPLTLEEEAPRLTAERTVTMDFANCTPDGEWKPDLLVNDGYVLSNPTGEDVTATALYPFAGNFANLQKVRPVVRVGGEAVETRLAVGGYCGGFQGFMSPDSDNYPGLYNLKPPQSWEDYREAMSGGAYQEEALAPPPALDEPVTVYVFDDAKGPTEEYQAATFAIDFTIDPARTTVYTWNFNGSSGEEERRYSFFVDRFGRWQPRYLIVQGEDIGPYTAGGYENGACEAGIDGVSVEITRRETTFGEILKEIVKDFQKSQQTDYWEDAANVPTELLYRAAAQSLLEYGSIARYDNGRLDDIVADAAAMNRVFYLAFDVTIPAGGSVEVSASFTKEASFDFHCGEPESQEIYGYDLTTRLGSCLTFTAQRAELVNAEGIEIVRQNFGFDLEKGVTKTELDAGQDHYYLEVRHSRT